MKRRRMAFAAGSLALAACIAFSGCKEEDGDLYRRLEELGAAEYAAISLHAEIALDGLTLCDDYTVEKTGDGYTAEYAVERASVIEKDENGGYVPPKTVKTTVSGVLENVRGGELLPGGGTLPAGLSPSQPFRFEEGYFSDVVQSEGYFSADVTDPYAFFGQTEADGMTLEIFYRENAFERLTLRYRAESGAAVVYCYTYS